MTIVEDQEVQSEDEAQEPVYEQSDIPTEDGVGDIYFSKNLNNNVCQEHKPLQRKGFSNTDQIKQPVGHSFAEKIENNQIENITCDESIFEKLQVPPGFEDKELIAIEGKWYDITDFISVHPGGDIIKQLVSREATSAFRAIHQPGSLRGWRPVATYKKRNIDKFNTDLDTLRARLLVKGYYRINKTWYLLKVMTIPLLILACAFVLYLGTSFGYRFIAAIILFFVWQQSGFLMHDSLHHQMHVDPQVSSWLGTVFGSLGSGICGSWWYDEHRTHHALLALVSPRQGCLDPQMCETTWAQNQLLFPFFRTTVERIAVKIQFVTFLPLCVFLGRIAITIDSFREERRLKEWLALVLHFTWCYALVLMLPDWYTRLEFYIMASSFQGILHIQLLISHYCKPFTDSHDFCTTRHWSRIQVESNINIKTPTWMDWFHGGLNFHIEHHLFPRMPRHNLRSAGRYVKELCKLHNVEYDECGWFQAIARTLVHLKKMSSLFSLDPR